MVDWYTPQVTGNASVKSGSSSVSSSDGGGSSPSSSSWRQVGVSKTGTPIWEKNGERIASYDKPKVSSQPSPAPAPAPAPSGGGSNIKGLTPNMSTAFGPAHVDDKGNITYLESDKLMSTAQGVGYEDEKGNLIIVDKEPIPGPFKPGVLPSQSKLGRRVIKPSAPVPSSSKADFLPFPAGEYRAASAEDIEAMEKQHNPFYQFGSALKGSFFLEPDTARQLQGTNTALAAGSLFGLTLGVATMGEGSAVFGAGSKLAKASKAGSWTSKTLEAAKASKAGQIVIKADSLVSKNWWSRWVKDLSVASLQTAAITEGVEKIGEFKAPPAEQAILKQDYFSDAIGYGFRVQSEALKKRGFWYGLADELPVIGGLLEKDAYEGAVTAYFQAEGLQGGELNAAINAAMRERKYSGIGETASLLNIARASEKIGRREIVKKFEGLTEKGFTIPSKKVGGEMFKLVFNPIGRAGAVEGVTSELAQELARERAADFLSMGLMGAGGYASAGLLGGAIAGTSVNKGGASKVLEYSSYLMDPFEKPGDLLQDLSEAGVKQLGGKVKVPTIVMPGGSSVSVGVTQKSKTVPPASGGRSSGVGGGSPVSLPFVQPVQVEAFSIGSNVPVNVPAKPAVRSPVFTPGEPVPIVPNPFVPQPVMVPEFTPNPNIPTSTEIPVNVPINVPSVINTVVPVITPLFRIPPPVPLAFPAFGGGIPVQKGKGKKKYVDEVTLAFGAMQESIAGNFAKPVKYVKSVPRKKKGKKAKVSASRKSQPEDVLNFFFGGGFAPRVRR